MVSRLKLRALGYPQDSIIPDPAHITQFQSIIQFLESTHLLAYPSSERGFLHPDKLAQFEKEVGKYLSVAKCPLEYTSDANSREAIAEWLIQEAINHAYEVSSAAKINAHMVNERRREEEHAQRLLESMSFLSLNDADFKSGLDEMVEMLGIAPHPDPLIILRAAEKLISHLVTMKKLTQDDAMDAGQHKDVEKQQFSLADFDLGVHPSGSKGVDLAIKVLRLLHVGHLRELQTRVNELLVKVQKVTADPKADVKLGRVGR